MVFKLPFKNPIQDAFKGNKRTSLKVPLAWVLVVPSVVQVTVVMGGVGYLADRNGKTAVADLTGQLMGRVSQSVENELTDYLSNALKTHQIHHDAVRSGLLDLNLERINPDSIRYVWSQMRSQPNLTWIRLGTPTSGSSIGLWRPGVDEPLQVSIANPTTQLFNSYHRLSDKGEVLERVKLEKPKFDARTRPWYRQAIEANRVIWTDIYAGFTPGTICVAASQPLYNPQGKFVGVIGTDISLNNIQMFLAHNKVSQNSQTFIIERSGLLVSSSSQEPSFEILSGQKPRRLHVSESRVNLIKSTAESLGQEFAHLDRITQKKSFQFKKQGMRYWAEVVPFSMEGGLEWLIVVVVPEADVMGKIQTNTQDIIWLCLIAIIAMSKLNLLIGRWFIGPINQLQRVSQNLTHGFFDQAIPDSSIQELSTLSKSFSYMSQEIQFSRRKLENYSRSLEQIVDERTQELQAEVASRIAAETALQAINLELKHLAYLDGVTQIANRRRFDEWLMKTWRNLEREQGNLSIILCDVDYFKSYNDFYGHQAGDRCLQMIAKAIKDNVQRPLDLAARYSGAEFAVILPNTNEVQALHVAHKIQHGIQALQLPHANSELGDWVTLSFGVCTVVPGSRIQPSLLIQAADQALYEAKQKGRNQVAVRSIEQ